MAIGHPRLAARTGIQGPRVGGPALRVTHRSPVQLVRSAALSWEGRQPGRQQSRGKGTGSPPQGGVAQGASAQPGRLCVEVRVLAHPAARVRLILADDLAGRHAHRLLGAGQVIQQVLPARVFGGADGCGWRVRRRGRRRVVVPTSKALPVPPLTRKKKGDYASSERQCVQAQSPDHATRTKGSRTRVQTPPTPKPNYPTHST